jgi:hypothetical protein
MNEQQRAELERIRDVLYPATGLEDYDEEIIGRVLKDIKALLAQSVPVKCWCHKCNEHNTVNGLPFSMTQMILCPECGNKRCPKASDHQLDCTGSNEAGQHGSVYTAPQPVPVQEPVATLFGSLPVYDTAPPAAQPDYAWPTIADYEKEVGFEVNDAFKAAWTMARTTNDLFKQMGENT